MLSGTCGITLKRQNSIVDDWNTECNYYFLSIDEHLMMQCVEIFLIIWIQLTLGSNENNIEKGK